MTTAADRGRGGLRLGLVLVLVLAALVRLHLVLRPLAALDGKSLPDDAYISLEIARSIGQGEGPRCGGQLTNGYQPLYVFLMALPFALAGERDDIAGRDAMVKVALALLGLVDLGSVLLWFAILRRRFGARRGILLVPLWWALHPVVLATAMNGLETSLAVFCLLLVWWWSERAPVVPLRSWLVMGLLLGLAAMARIDLLILALWVALVWSWRLLCERGGFAALVPRGGVLAAALLVGYAPWLIYSGYTTGRILPISGAAVRFQALANFDHALGIGVFSVMLRRGAQAVAANTPVLLAAAGVMLLALLRRRLRRGSAWRAPADAHRWLVVPVGFGVLLFLAYPLYVLAFWYFPRYLFPLSVPLLALAAHGVLRAGWARGRAAGIGLVALVLASCLGRPLFWDLVMGPEDRNLGYRNLGLWARQRFPPGTTVGSSQTGALAYYASDLDVVNLDGVVNEAVFRSLQQRRNLQYLRARGVEYVVGWEVNLRFILRHSRHAGPQDLVHVETVQGFRSWDSVWHVYRVTR